MNLICWAFSWSYDNRYNTYLFFFILKIFLKKFNFFYFLFASNQFFYAFRLFWYINVKNNFKKNKKIYYFNTFSSEKYFEKQPQPHPNILVSMCLWFSLFFFCSFFFLPCFSYCDNLFYLLSSLLNIHVVPQLIYLMNFIIWKLQVFILILFFSF